jgi:hypothetical protein
LKNNVRGGMCTSGTHNSIYCPLCNKPAATATLGLIEIYRHFTKSGMVSHIKLADGTWRRKRGAIL